MNALVLALLVAGAGIRPYPAMRDPGIRPPTGAPATFTLDALPYTRTVTCGSITLTGTYPGAWPLLAWTTLPTDEGGPCDDLGAGLYECVVDVTPTSVGDGVETITITDGFALNDKTAVVGFYVDGEHSCFLSQNVNGAYNVGLSDLDAVATWENLGSSALDVTQGTGAAQPTFRTSIVGGQPVVRYDGGDSVGSALAADWIFLNDSADWTAEQVYLGTSASLEVIWSTQNIVSNTTSRGMAIRHSGGATNAPSITGSNGATAIVTDTSTSNTVPQAKFSSVVMVHDDDGGAGADFFWHNNGSAAGDGTAGTYSALAPAFIYRIGSNNASGFEYNGDLFRVLIYQSALTSTQRGINKAVDEWALGGTLPVTP